MKRYKNLTIFLLCIFCIFFTVGCDVNNSVIAKNQFAIKGYQLEISSENEISIDIYSGFLTAYNIDYEEEVYYALQGTSNTTYQTSHSLSNDNDFTGQVIGCDTGRIHLQLDIYLHVKYKGKILPYAIHINNEFYTISNNEYIELYTDKKCTTKADFNFECKDIHYSTGDVYSDKYAIDFKFKI